VTVPSSAELTRARVARRFVALLLVVAGITACVLSVLNITGGFVGDFRFLVTTFFLILGPGWSAAGFLRRAPAAHVWMLTVGVGVATTLLVAQVMVSTGEWRPAIALYVMTVLSVPLLLRHAVVAQ
jgi:nitrate reductase NapE component